MKLTFTLFIAATLAGAPLLAQVSPVEPAPEPVVHPTVIVKPAPPVVAPPTPVPVVTPVIQQAPTITLKDLLAGKVVPLTIRIKDMDNSWIHFLMGSSDNQNVSLLFSSMFGGSAGGFYTKGEIQAIGETRYLVAYAIAVKKIDPDVLRQQSAPPSIKITEDTELRLSLLNLQQTSITDIRSFNLQEELTPISISNTAPAPAPVPFSNEQTTPPPAPVKSQNNAEITSLNNLRQLMLATFMYVQDHNDVFPPMINYNGIKTSLMKYVKNDNIFYMPENHTPYAFNPLLNKHPMRTILKPAKLVVYYEPGVGSDGRRGAAFADGHVSRLSPSEWQLAKKASRINR